MIFTLVWDFPSHSGKFRWSTAPSLSVFICLNTLSHKVLGISEASQSGFLLQKSNLDHWVYSEQNLQPQFKAASVPLPFNTLCRAPLKPISSTSYSQTPYIVDGSTSDQTDRCMDFLPCQKISYTYQSVGILYQYKFILSLYTTSVTNTASHIHDWLRRAPAEPAEPCWFMPIANPAFLLPLSPCPSQTDTLLIASVLMH